MLDYPSGEAAYGFSSEEEQSHGIAGGSTQKSPGSGAHESRLPLPGDGPHVQASSQCHDAEDYTGVSTILEGRGGCSADSRKKGTFCSACRRRG